MNPYLTPDMEPPSKANPSELARAACRGLAWFVMPSRLIRAVPAASAVLLQAALGVSVGCAPPREPVAVAMLSVDRASVPLGASVEVSIQFNAGRGFNPSREDYRVFLSFLDSDKKLLWSYEHDPPVPTSSWQAGQPVQYRRRVRIPTYPHHGTAVIAIGLRSPESGERVTLAGDDMGGFAYRAATLVLEPRHESNHITYEDGWHGAEFNVLRRITWRWTTGRAAFSFPNPRSTIRLTLDVQATRYASDRPQRLSLVVDERTLREATLDTNSRTSLDYELTPSELGDSDDVRVELLVDPTFVPVDENVSSRDDRELGIRVFDAYVEPVS